MSGRIKNIILVVCDALRKSNLNCYGYPVETSPNISKLAEQSVVFDNAWTVSNKTDPAFTSIETGKLPNDHGIIHHANNIKPEELKRIDKLPTIAKELKKQGFDTFGLDFLGRWHKQGFDYYMGINERKKSATRAIEGIRELFHIKPGSFVQNVLEKTPMYNLLLGMLFRNRETPYKPAKQLTDEAVQITEVQQAEGRPTFLFIHYWDTHIPYWPPKSYIRHTDYRNLYSNIDLRLSEIRKSIRAPLRRFFFDCMMAGNRNVNDVINQYDGEIRYIDDNFGRLIDALDMNETLLIFTADHGESLVEDNIFFTHDGFNECVMRVPLIVWFPGCGHKRIDRHVDITYIKGMITNVLEGRDLI